MKELDRQLDPNESVLRTRVMSEGGSAPTEARPLNRLHPIDEGSGPMASMPAADTNRAHPPEMSLADACPSCVLNLEPPRSAARIPGGWTAAYLCSSCGHAWTTDWKD
jgi:hypothetical protein